MAETAIQAHFHDKHRQTPVRERTVGFHQLQLLTREKNRAGAGVPTSVGLCRVTTTALNRENERQGGVSGAQQSGK